MAKNKGGSKMEEAPVESTAAPATYADGAPMPGGTPIAPDALAPAPEVPLLAVESNGQKKPAETKAQRFRRLAATRMGKVLVALDRLTPLANKAQYDWAPEEATYMLDTLTDKVDEIRRAFEGQKRSAPVFYFR